MEKTNIPLVCGLYFTAILTLTLPLLAWSQSVVEDCPVTKNVQVQGSDELADESKYRQTRNSLLNQLLVEAVERVNGIEIINRSASRLRMENDKIDETSESLDVAKSQGLIQSYSFPADGEIVENTEVGLMLKLTLDVVVCDHSNVEGNLYVSIGRIEFKNYDGYNGEDLANVVAGVIPSESNIHYVMHGGGEQYSDYSITGQILSVGVTQEENRFLKAIALTFQTSSGEDIVESKVYRMSAIVAMKAQNDFDNSYTVVHETIEKKISTSLQNLDRHIDEFIATALQDVSLQLFDKIQHQKDFKKPR